MPGDSRSGQSTCLDPCWEQVGEKRASDFLMRGRGDIMTLLKRDFSKYYEHIHENKLRRVAEVQYF